MSRGSRRLLHDEIVALTSVLRELESMSQALDGEEADPTRYLRTISERLPEISGHLYEYADAIVSTWSDIRQSDGRLLGLIDLNVDADLSLARQRQAEILRIQEMARACRDDVEALRALFDFVWATSGQSHLSRLGRRSYSGLPGAWSSTGCG